MATNRLIRGYTSSILISGLVHAIPLTLMIVNYDRPTFPSPTSLTIEVNWQQSSPSPLAAQPFKTAKITSSKEIDIPVSSNAPQKPEEIQYSAPSPILPTQAEESEALAVTNRKPIYPEEARLLGIEGTVMIRLIISSDGTIQEAGVLKPKAHPILEQAALEQIKGWRFPSYLSSHSITIPIKFELEE